MKLDFTKPYQAKIDFRKNDQEKVKIMILEPSGQVVYEQDNVADACWQAQGDQVNLKLDFGGTLQEKGIDCGMQMDLVCRSWA